MSRLRRIGSTLEAWKLVRERSSRVPTWRGYLLLCVLFVAGMMGAVRQLYPFLAVTERASADVLVVEGWALDFVMQAGLEEFRRGGYRVLYITGGPIEKGGNLSEYGSYAELGRATLERLGAPRQILHAVPAPKVRRDRTFASAVALRDWLRQQGRLPGAINVVTADAHARRTRLFFERAFGEGVAIGIIAAPDERFDGSNWWRSSQGFRTVVDETIAYVYSRIFSAVAEDLAEP